MRWLSGKAAAAHTSHVEAGFRDTSKTPGVAASRRAADMQTCQGVRQELAWKTAGPQQVSICVHTRTGFAGLLKTFYHFVFSKALWTVSLPLNLAF